MTEELLSVKELAEKLKRSDRYVWQMRKLGFRFIAGRTTLTAAIKWLSVNPSPFSSKVRKTS